MKWIMRAYAGVLLLYTGWRTFDFVLQQLPTGSTSIWLAILFLFATEAGLAIWHEVSINHTTTFAQHHIAIVMTWLDFAGSLGAGVADMILRQTLMAGYQVPEWIALGLIFGLPLLMAANVAGIFIYLQNDAQDLRARQKRFLQFEADEQAFKALSENRARLAKVKKAEIYSELSGEDLTGNNKPGGVTIPAKNGHNGHDKDEVPLLVTPLSARRPNDSPPN